jgi:DNA-binding transcriptional regulator YiaG
MEFKDKVKFAREKLVLSQAEFANELGVAFASVNRWENGVRTPTYALQRKFYDYCEKKGIVFPDAHIDE